MSNPKDGMRLGVNIRSITEIFSRALYENPMAFLRENLQNAIDAVRIHAHRKGGYPEDSGPLIEITVDNNTVSVRDRGIGMSLDDLGRYYWTIGTSGKTTEEARMAGCIGMYGIGGFANFGVCAKLEVTSQTLGSSTGTKTWLFRSDLENESGHLPTVHYETSSDASPNGTIVTGELDAAPNVRELRDYIRGFVQHVLFPISFNGEVISGERLVSIDEAGNYRRVPGSPRRWQSGSLEISGTFLADKKDTLAILLQELKINDRPCNISGYLRFEAGPIEIFRGGFKICATKIVNQIGVSGKISCAEFSPTAGRDTLNNASSLMLANMCATLENAAIRLVLENPSMIPQHTRIFRYVVQNDLIDLLGNVNVRLADATSTSLESIANKRAGDVKIYYGKPNGNNLSQIMHARGHVVVALPSERFHAEAVKCYLERKCQAKSLSGMVECSEIYGDLSQFEKVFMSELSILVPKNYEVGNIRLIPGKLSEDIPVYVTDPKEGTKACIYVDVRHQEVTKLKRLGITPILFSLISVFFRDYIGGAIKKWSPRFFGSGALNLEFLAGKRSELWILVEDEIGEIRPARDRQIVSASDIHTVDTSSPNVSMETQSNSERPKLLRIIDNDSRGGLAGYYIRLLDSAFHAYGDILTQYPFLGIVWAGNRIVYAASDEISSSFNYEIRVDRVISVSGDSTLQRVGADQITIPLQAHHESLYFPIPSYLEEFLVPHDQDEIRIELHCDWFDFQVEKQWTVPVQKK